MKTFRYSGARAREVSMPVGGVGAGCLGLAGNGALADWEIMNEPGKGVIFPFTHFAVKAETARGTFAKVLQGDHQRELSGHYAGARYGHYGFGYGPDAGTMAGFPHFESCEFIAAFPTARVGFSDERFPGAPALEAFSSFIPLDEDASSLPCAFFTVEIKNTSRESVVYRASFTLAPPFEKARTRALGGGLYMTEGARGMCVMTDAQTVSAQNSWYRGGWFDAATVYWEQYSRPGFLPPREYPDAGRACGTLEAEIRLAPGETGRARFCMAWYFPDWEVKWDREGGVVRNWYATRFSGADDVCAFALKNWDELSARTGEFAESLYSGSLPDYALEAAGANLSTLVTPVCHRLEDGSFWAWEGASELGGSCEGTCQHVWNYVYALSELFPRLAASVRENEAKYSFMPDGRMAFRLKLPAGEKKGWEMPCVDGQMGFVLGVYREWLISGDEKWLKKMWPSAKRALEFAWDGGFVKWDADRDGVLEGRQHHTLDMELFGPSSWLEGFYIAALTAGARMAKQLGEDDAGYLRLAGRGKEFLNTELFNGEYYFQKIDLRDKSALERFSGAADTYWNDEAGEIKYQIGEGLIIDQALAQWHSNMLGLGEIFEGGKLDTALRGFMKHNFKRRMCDFANPCRVFSLNDEAGAIMCAYPEGREKPAISVPYCEETMTGFEYAAACLLLQRGFFGDAMALVRAVRERYDGEKRNPFNEIECGSNYSRAMASFSLIRACLGAVYNGAEKSLTVKPPCGDFAGPFFTAHAWGDMRVREGEFEYSLRAGGIPLSSIELPFAAEAVFADGERVKFSADARKVTFDGAIVVKHNIRVV